MDNETKDTLKKVAAYAVEEKNQQRKQLYRATGWIACCLLITTVLFSRETKGLLNGLVSDDVCGVIMLITLIIAIATLAFQILLGKGTFDSFIEKKKHNRKTSTDAD